MYNHDEQDDIVINILSQIANESNKSLERIKRLLLIKRNKAVNRRFWQILDKKIPGHHYSYVGCCGECGSLELREDLPPTAII